MKRSVVLLICCMLALAQFSCSSNLYFKSPVPKAGTEITELPGKVDGIYLDTDSSQLIVVKGTSASGLEFVDMEITQDTDRAAIIEHYKDSSNDFDDPENAEDSVDLQNALVRFSEMRNDLIEPYLGNELNLEYEDKYGMVLSRNGQFYVMTILNALCKVDLKNGEFDYTSFLSKLTGKPILKEVNGDYFLSVEDAKDQWYMVRMHTSEDTLAFTLSTVLGEYQGIRFEDALAKYNKITPITTGGNNFTFLADPTDEAFFQLLKENVHFKKKQYVKLNIESKEPASRFNNFFLAIGGLILALVLLNLFLRKRINDRKNA